MRRRSFWWGLLAIACTLSVLFSRGWQLSGTATAAVPIIAQGAENEFTVARELTLSGIYEDPQGTFQIGILDGYSINTVSGSPLFQTGDGSLAYSVVQVALATEVPLSDIGLVDIAQRTFGRGEGFQTQTFNTVPGGGVQITWTGQLSQGRTPPQPLSGTILVKQQATAAYLLIVAAADDATAQVPAVIATLIETLTLL